MHPSLSQHGIYRVPLRKQPFPIKAVQSDVRVLQLYKPCHTRDILKTIFVNDCHINDEVLKKEIHGHQEVYEYFEAISKFYDDVYVTDVRYSSNGCMSIKWKRIQRDGRVVCGHDHVVMKNNKYQYIHSFFDRACDF